MEAIICNAGSGTRLKEIGSHFINKGLIKDPNNEKSILWYQIDALNYIGVKNVYVVVSTTTNDAFKVEVEKIRGRFNNMNIQCVTGNTSTMIDSIKKRLESESPIIYWWDVHFIFVYFEMNNMCYDYNTFLPTEDNCPNWTIIDDFTDDFDYPEEFTKWRSLYEQR